MCESAALNMNCIHEMPGFLDEDLYRREWVRLSVLWEEPVGREPNPAKTSVEMSN